MKFINDWTWVGSYFRHYTKPPKFTEPMDGIEDTACAKLAELSDRLLEIESEYELECKRIVDENLHPLYRQVARHKLEDEKKHIELWQAYWQRFLQPVKTEHEDLTQAIERARAYPIENLVHNEMRPFGALLRGACPFHDERTPSFVIYPDNGYHCFGCQAHGNNAVDFYLTLNPQETFLDAVRSLS